MRVGVVCEGPTDFIAIKAFFCHSLAHHKIAAEFVAIQPEKDKSSPKGGWSNVLHWLIRNPPEARIQEFFKGGLFAGENAQPPFDCLLIHLDTDILGDKSFENFIAKNFGYHTKTPKGPVDRAREISDILKLAWRDQNMTKVDKERHVPAVSVESTENWCVAAYSAKPCNFELLSGQDLVDQFMSVLEEFERRQPKTSYAKISKNIKRREDFCDGQKSNSRRISLGCHHFQLILERLLSLAASEGLFEKPR